MLILYWVIQHFIHNSFVSLDFVITSMISCFGQNLGYSKLVKRGYMHSLLLKYFERFCLTYNINEKYGEKKEWFTVLTYD